MKKVKLTPEQVKALEKWKGMAKNREILLSFTGDSPVGDLKKYRWLDELECLKSLSFEEMALALCDWYEIDELFKVGDWVTWEGSFKNYTGKILEIYESEVLTDIKFEIYGANQRFPKATLRKATEEEIKAEEERRRWAAIGRKPGEFKKGDIVRVIEHDGYFDNGHKYGAIGEVEHDKTINDPKEDGGVYVTINGSSFFNYAELIVPVEQRFDLQGDDDESSED